MLLSVGHESHRSGHVPRLVVTVCYE